MQQRQETSRGNAFGDGSSTQRLEDRIRSNSPLSGAQRYVHHMHGIITVSGFSSVDDSEAGALSNCEDITGELFPRTRLYALPLEDCVYVV